MSQVFNYKARDLSGKMIRGKAEGESQGGVAALLREKNYFAVEIKPARSINFNIENVIGLKIDIKSMAILCRQFTVMLAAGIPLLQCLNVLALQTENKHLTKILQDAISGIKKGKSLSEAFKVHEACLPEIFVNMISAGEISGAITQVMARLTTHFEWEHRSREKIKSALAYPLLVAVMMLASLVTMLIFVVPVFAGVFDSMGAELPLPTRMVISISRGLTSYWYLFLTSAAIFTLMLKRIGTHKKAGVAFNLLMLTVPFLGKLAHQTIIARFVRTLATLLMGGISLTKSLQIVENVSGNTLAAQEIKKVRVHISEGERMSLALKKSTLFPPMVVHMIAVGEESGRLDDILEKLAVFYEEDADSLFNRLSSVIEPLLIVLMGIMVAFVALSVYLPLFGLADVMQTGSGTAGGM
jgi:type IV pilus assembly protein PilC